MKATVRYIERNLPEMARLIFQAKKGRIRFIRMSRRELEINGPQFLWKGWVFGVSRHGVFPIRLTTGAFYSPALHEWEDGDFTWADLATRELL